MVCFKKILYMYKYSHFEKSDRKNYRERSRIQLNFVRKNGLCIVKLKRNIVSCNKTTHNTIQYNTIQYNTIQYNTIQFNTIQSNPIQSNPIQSNPIQSNPIHKKKSFKKKE